jgi:hypothetical protein
MGRVASREARVRGIELRERGRFEYGLFGDNLYCSGEGELLESKCPKTSRLYPLYTYFNLLLLSAN